MANPGLTADQERALAGILAVYPLADELGRRFADAGHELYLVGGTVRDTFLGRDQTDLDFATSATPTQTEALVRGWADHVWLTGQPFGTVSASKHGKKLEITTFRAEAYTSGSRHPDVTYAPDIETDLSRRDFTINAMALRVPDHRFVDPFGGLRDLRDRLLRTPADPRVSFGDDPLRMVRLARFAATLGARADGAAVAAVSAMAARLDDISRERIRDELNRLVCAAQPRKGMDLLCDTGLAERFLPEVPALRMARDPLHRHKDVYAHTLAVVERCPADDLVLRLAALLHDVGKPATREFHPDGRVSFHHHEVVGARMARHRLRELRYPNETVEAVCQLVFLHLRFHGYAHGEWTDSAVRRYVRDAGTPEQLRRLNLLTRHDVTTQNKAKARWLARAMEEFEARIDLLGQQEELARIKPPLDGHQIMDHLGLDPGPLVGEARQMLLEARLDRGPIGAEEAYRLLDDWARQRGLPGD
ncbi:MAG: CCA tRNA nucleotidyltransferase [Actinomycetota bacterium]|nr:CCA tRNA nucleotidyltransferase [Actinomycetota bacterium]